MALPWLQRFELALFAAAFLCGAVAAAALTRTQVRLRGGAAAGAGRGERVGGGQPILTRRDHFFPGSPGPGALLLGADGPGEARSAAEVHRR